MKRLVALLLAIVMLAALLVTGFSVRAAAAGATPDDYTYEEFLAMDDTEKAAFRALFSSTAAYIQWVNAAREEYEAANPKDEIGDDGVIDLSGNVAKVGDTNYTSLDTAINAANGKTLVLLKSAGDISVSGNITIDLNGYTLGTVTLTDLAATVSSESDLTVTTSAANCRVAKSGMVWSVVPYSGSVLNLTVSTGAIAVVTVNGTPMEYASSQSVSIPYGAVVTVAAKAQAGYTSAAVNGDTSFTAGEEQSYSANISASVAVYVAKVNDETFCESLENAVECAAAGDTITMLDSVTVDSLTIPTGVTLDLNGETLTAAAVSADTAQILDGTQQGLLKTAVNSVVFNPENEQLPIYDETASGYRIAKAVIKTLEPEWTEDGVVYTFRFDLENTAWEQMLSDNAKVEIGIRIGWSLNGNANFENFKMTAEQIARVISVPTGGFKVTVTGLSEATDLSVSTWLCSAGATVVGGSYSK